MKLRRHSGVHVCVAEQLNIISQSILAQCFRRFRKRPFRLHLACTDYFGGGALSDLAHILRSPCHRQRRAVASRPAAAPIVSAWRVAQRYRRYAAPMETGRGRKEAHRLHDPLSTPLPNCPLAFPRLLWLLAP